ncbi:hypothetical protein WJX73_003847 [Symbiochloris irregularis]|uniref:Uncharacterized protein n=1 Tax=Symbiochloris irregularis TaxID=706552 RepID=A0AAW1P1X3_9CHLO
MGGESARAANRPADEETESATTAGPDGFELVDSPNATQGDAVPLLAATIAVAPQGAGVPLLAATTADLKYITARAPEFTPQMINVADLMWLTEPDLVDILNPLLLEKGLPTVDRVIETLRVLENLYASPEERRATQSVLTAFWIKVAGQQAFHCQEQWRASRECMVHRVRLARPLASWYDGNDERLRQTYKQIETDSGYLGVRELAMVLAEFLAEKWDVSLH